MTSITHGCRLAFAALSIISTTASAQSNQSAATVPVKILVHDSSGAVIPNAEVRVSAPEASLTDANGQTVLNVPPGEYDLAAIGQGFFNSKKHVSVTASGGQTVDFSLQVAFGNGPVIGPVVSISTNSPQIHSLIYPEGTLSIQTKSGQPEILNAANFRALPHKTVTFHNAHTNADEIYSGVPLTDLLAKYGAPTGKDLHGKPLSDYLVATGSDGYKAVLALAETYLSFHPGEVIVADAMDGKSLDAKEGPFKLVVTEDKRPARCVHNLVSIELRTAE